MYRITEHCSSVSSLCLGLSSTVTMAVSIISRFYVVHAMITDPELSILQHSEPKNRIFQFVFLQLLKYPSDQLHIHPSDESFPSRFWISTSRRFLRHHLDRPFPLRLYRTSRRIRRCPYGFRARRLPRSKRSPPNRRHYSDHRVYTTIGRSRVDTATCGWAVNLGCGCGYYQ